MRAFGSVKIHWLGHDSFVLEGSRVVIVDPFKAKGDYRADLILISHEHSDHLSPDDIKRFSSASTKVIAPEVCRPGLAGLGLEVTYLAPGSKTSVLGVEIETVPAYNTNKFREPGRVFHPQEEGRLGYVVTMDGLRLYHAGDTDHIPEMRGVSVDVALLPVSGTYVMTPEEAASAAREIEAKTFIPMHFGSIVGSKKDAEKFRDLLKGQRDVVILEQE